MAHAARSLELVQGLITSITGRPDATKAQCNQVIRGLREHNFARANQFAVKARLDGLIEKFSVLGRDELAEALQNRLDKLQTDDKFLPDKLALFLELSDLPHRKVDIGVLHEIAEPDVKAEEHLTWAQIIKDDPLDEDIWDDIERGYHSSGDEGASHDEAASGDSIITGHTSVDEDVSSLARAQLLLSDLHAPVEISSASRLTELRLVRETLFMLRGLPADLFAVNRQDGRVYPSTNANLMMTTQPTTTGLLNDAAATGSSLNFLRHWSRVTQSTPHIRSCQAAMQELLSDVDSEFSILEKNLVLRNGDVVVSMLQLCSHADQMSRPLISLAKTIRNAVTSTSNAEVVLLNALYEAACVAHATGDHGTLKIFSKVLVSGTVTFLRPITRWCLSGEIDSQEHNPLVVDKKPDCPLSSIWHERFALRLVDNQDDTMPLYLKDFARDLFAMGKSKMFYNVLHHRKSENLAIIVSVDSDLSRLADAKNDCIVFSEQWRETLSSWVAALAQSTSIHLPRSLIDDHGLLDQLTAIESIFLRRDGASFSHFSETLFVQLYSSHRGQLSDFMLTEMAREAFTSIPGIAEDEISMHAYDLHGSHNSGSILNALDSVDMQVIPTWYLANVLHGHGLATQRKIFAKLLQLDIAKRLLQQDISARRKWAVGRADKLQLSIYCLRQCLICFIDVVTDHITTISERFSIACRQDMELSMSLDHMVECYSKYATGLALQTLTHAGAKEVYKRIGDVLVLAEVLAQTNWTEEPQKMMHQVNNLLEQYEHGLLSIVAVTRELAQQQDAEDLEAFADALLACLPAHKRASA